MIKRKLTKRQLELAEQMYHEYWLEKGPAGFTREEFYRKLADVLGRRAR